ncbi:MAG: PaaI family thioesterase [Hydrogenophaga sp.]|nr:PaaI family thioesterase [Hydrogenophaga sp.]
MSAEAIQADWTRHFDETRARLRSGAGPGLADTAQLAGMNGLQQMQAMLEGLLPYPHIADTMDFALVEVGEGRAVFQGKPQLKHYNPLGSVHGGWYATLLDSALGCAVHTTLPVGRGYTTAELGVNIVRAASHKSGPLRAIGTVLHAGRQLATAEARIVGADGKLYAHATTTCLVFEAPAR